MKIQSVFDKAYKPYGQVLEGYDFSPLIKELKTLNKPQDSVFYTPSSPELEALPLFGDIMDRYFGGAPIEIGYCSGTNTMLNCLEYHRDSEVNICVQDTIMLLGHQYDILDWKYDTSGVEAFLVPAGTAVEFFATTLHYAPCDASPGAGFSVGVVLPRGTNTDKPNIREKNQEDALLFARNKWLLALPGTNEARQGGYVGLTGDNIDILPYI